MKETKESDAGTASARQRSPNYPSNSLMEAVAIAKSIYDKEKRTVLNGDSVAQAMGYPKGANGASRGKLASLRKYGLVDNIGDGVQISQLALRILHQPESSQDYIAAVQEAALRPEIFKQFYESHKDASEQSIQSELIVKRGFSPEGAKAFAKAFRETIVFAKLEQQQYSPSSEGDKSKVNNAALSGSPATPPPPQASNTITHLMPSATNILPGELPVPIAAGLVARVPFPMSEDDFELLIGTLQLWKKKLVRKAVAIPPSVKLPANATWNNNDSDKPVRIVAVMGERDGEIYYQSDDGTGIPASQLRFQ
jgi:hypothetical protein